MRGVLKSLRRISWVDWVIAGMVVVIVVVIALLRGPFTAKLTDPDWVIDTLINVAIFPILTALLVGWRQHDLDWRARKPYEGWSWKIIRKDTPPEVDDIFWRDAESYVASQFERWRAVKSCVTTTGILQVDNIDAARQREWLVDPMRGFDPDGPARSPHQKVIVIDFTKMKDHIELRRPTQAPSAAVMPPAEPNRAP